MVDELSTVQIIRASAGTGKTYRLAREFRKSLNTSGSIICPTQIIATTFTNKAASELINRIRVHLLSEQLWEPAQALFAATIGTVNSVCSRIISDLSMEAGLSPSTKVISEQDQNETFQIAVDEVMDFYASALNKTIYRMGKESDWRNDVQRICDLARQNDIAPALLSQFAQSSWFLYQQMLVEPSANRQSFEVELLEEIRIVMTKLPAEDDETKTTAKAIEFLREFELDWHSTGELQWSKLVKLKKLSTGKLSRPFIQRLIAITDLHQGLPEFHLDVKTLINGMFQCASDCLKVYSEFKSERGILDFIDQERIALLLLRNSKILKCLDGRFHAQLIDEFQDTSPIQLAVFLELRKIVKSTIFVGDEKQSIYGFRGSDPELMQSAIKTLITTEHEESEYLSKSYRSRPELVEFVNNVFRNAMRTAGIHPNQVMINECARHGNPSLGEAIHVWWLKGTNEANSIKALAQQVMDILRHKEDWNVETSSGVVNPLKGTDIAILCRSNSTRLELAAGLAKAGVLVSTERPALLNRPECVLSIAVLRYLADKYDTLALAEIIRYSQPESNPQQWLFDWIDGGIETVRQSTNIIFLESIRSKLNGLTPVESIQLATTCPFVLEAIIGWGDYRQRLLNLEALSGLAKSYEEFCDASRSTATIGGLVTFISKNRNAFQPANTDGDAVHVLTYHKAKGLEWPAVILYDLDAPPEATPFGVSLCSAKSFDSENPLAERSIRYWPWPYGQQKSDIPLADVAKNREEMDQARSLDTAESLRLLYTGMTRARDYLILACNDTPHGTDLLQMVKDEFDNCVFDLSSKRIGTVSILHRHSELLAECKLVESLEDDCDYQTLSYRDKFGPRANHIQSKAESAPYSLVPSSMRLAENSEKDSPVFVDKIENLGGRFAFSETTDIRSLGDALHLFLATDDPANSKEIRLSKASQITTNYCISGLSADQFVEMSNRLQTKIDEIYPDAKWLREWPITGKSGAQRTKGIIDLLLELPEGFVIIDHKTFPGNFESWTKRAISHFPQLDCYAKIVQQASSRPVIATYIHMPIVGSLLKLKAKGEYKTDSAVDLAEESWLIF